MSPLPGADPVDCAFCEMPIIWCDKRYRCRRCQAGPFCCRRCLHYHQEDEHA